MISTTLHKDRVRQDLIGAGMTRYGLMKSASRYLHTVIHENERIRAVAYGLNKAGAGLMGSCMLVGTDRRVIFFDHKPGFTVSDEIDFDMVAGVKYAHTGPFSSITLHTHRGDYELRYVNGTCARNFINYIEELKFKPESHPLAGDMLYQMAMAMTPEAKNFLLSHDTGVLSTEDRQGKLHGAAVYYMVGEDEKIYILTRSGTTKAHDILSNEQIALTIYDDDPPSTLQIQGIANIETDQVRKDEVFKKMTKPRVFKKGVFYPPVTSLREGTYTVIVITPNSANFHPYGVAI